MEAQQEGDLTVYGKKLKALCTDRNLWFVVLFIAVVIRIYYFVVTFHQPQWWDSGDYLNIARMWAFGEPTWDINPLRPLLFPFFIAIIYKLGGGEAIIQASVILSSLITIISVYLLGKHMFSKKAGLLAAFMLTVFWSFTFYSFRILVDVPVAMFWFLAFYTFWAGFEENKRRVLWLFGPLLALAFMIKFTGALIGFIVLLYLIVTTRLQFLKNKDLWISAALGFLITLPFLIYEKIKFGSFLAFYTAAIGGRAPSPRSVWQTFIDYVTQTLPLVHWPLLILFIAGLLFILLDLVLGFDLLVKNKNKALKANFMVLLVFLVPFLYIVSIGYGAYIEERYLFLMYPTMFMIAAHGFLTANSYVTKITPKILKHIPLVLLLGLLAIGTYQNLVHGDQLIKIKKDSYIQAQLAGEWIKENSEKDARIFALHTHAEIQYAADRKVLGYPGKDPEEFLTWVKKEKPKYVISNVMAVLPPEHVWKVTYPFEHPEYFKPVQAYGPYIDEKQQIPILTVFEVLPAMYSVPAPEQGSKNS